MLGIDLSDNHIKVVQLKPLGRGRFELEAGGIGEMPKVSFLSNDENEWLKVAEALKKVLAEANVTTKEAVFALPEASVFFTILEIPLVPEEKISEVINLEARRYIPFPVNEVELDWQILETNQKFLKGGSTSGGKKIKLFLAAALKKTVEKYRRIAQLAGIDLKVIEVQVLALERSLVPENYEEPVLILEWGDSNVNFVIMERGIPLFGKRLDLGSRLLNDELAKLLKIDLEKAKIMKERASLSDIIAPGVTMQMALKKQLESITFAINQAVTLFNERNKTKVHIVLLSGGGSLLKGLPEYLQTNLKDLKIHLANPWQNIEIDPNLKLQLQKTAPQFSVVVGLAKRD